MNIVRRDRSCREVVEATLSSIEETQGRLNAFTAVRAEAALAEAEALDRNDRHGPAGLLHGVPVVVKDLFDVAGLPTTGACAAYQAHVARRHAAAVSALRRAGAIVIAKTNQHELGAGATGLVSCFGPTCNPHDPERITGGSSSGSGVAVAAGVVPLALGSDTGGSIRIPASFCGITGLRPTPGRVSLGGAQAMSPGYDAAGPMAATARECSIAFAALTGATSAATITPDAARRRRIGMPAPYFRLLDAATQRGVETAARTLEELGAHVDWLDAPDLDQEFAGFRHVWADLAYHHHDLWDDPKVSDEVRALIDTGRHMSGVDYARSRAIAASIGRQFAEALSAVDFLLMPTTPFPAPRADEVDVEVDGGALDVHRGAPSRLTVPVNEAGLPALAFPTGTTSDGLPLSAQLVGPPYSDERLLDVAAAFQASLSAPSARGGAVELPVVTL